MRFHKLMSISIGAACFALLALWLALTTGTAAAHEALRPVLQPSIRIALVKTLGTEPGVCATTSEVTVWANTPLYPCFIVTNIGTVPLTVTSLSDSELPPLPAFIIELEAGEVISLTDLGGLAGTFVFTPTASTVTTATVNATYENSVDVSATANADVDVVHPFFLPLHWAPLFSATIDVVPSQRTLRVGEMLSVRLAVAVRAGCQFPIYELKLIQAGPDAPLFQHVTPPNDTVGPGVGTPYTYELRATQPGTVEFQAQAYGERNCGDYWNWTYVNGSSGTVTVVAED